MDTKICSVCKLELPIDDFHKQKGKKSGRKSACRKCTSDKAIVYLEENRETINGRRRALRSANWTNWFKMQLLPSHLEMDAKRGYGKSDLDWKYLANMLLEQNGRCKISGMKMTHQSGDLRACSIDRLDNSIGHRKGNVQLVCLWANRAKHRHSSEELRLVLEEFKKGE